MLIELMSEISTGRHSVVRSWSSLESAKSLTLRATDSFQVASQAGKQGDSGGVLSGDEGYREGTYIWFNGKVIRSLTPRIRPHPLLHIFPVQPVPPTSSARQRAEEAGWRTTRKATILSRETLTRLTSAHLQKRIPGERARRVKAVVRKEA